MLMRYPPWHELIFEVHLPSVQADALDGAAGGQQHCASRGLIHPPGLHAHKPALHNVNAPNAIVTSHLHSRHLPFYNNGINNVTE